MLCKMLNFHHEFLECLIFYVRKNSNFGMRKMYNNSFIFQGLLLTFSCCQLKDTYLILYTLLFPSIEKCFFYINVKRLQNTQNIFNNKLLCSVHPKNKKEKPKEKGSIIFFISPQKVFPYSYSFKMSLHFTFLVPFHCYDVQSCEYFN